MTDRIARDPDACFMQVVGAKLDYWMNWKGGSKPFLSAGETIATSEWTAPDDVTLSDASSADTTTMVWATSQKAGTYRLRNKITTSDGRIDERSIYLTITD